jgi:hypothetical protein
MSFVPAPQQASAATAKSSNAVTSNQLSSQEADAQDNEAVFKTRTFDVLWVERSALMYKDGISKTFDKETRKASVAIKRKSSIPIILRDMAPPEGSIFDPARKWEEERERRRIESQAHAEAEAAAAAKEAAAKKKGKKAATKSKSTADSIIERNDADKAKKDLDRDLQKLANVKSLKAMQDATCETKSGKIHRMLKMLHFAVADKKQATVDSSEAEILDILWALEEMPVFKEADSLIAAEKAYKKQAKEAEKDKKSSKKDSKKESKKSSKKESKKDKEEEKAEKVVLTTEAKTLKDLYKDGGDSRGSYKDSLKYARK